jgi:long-chain acyl-CoA synthetase
MQSQSVIGAFLEKARELNGEICVRYKDGGSWKCLNWEELADQALSMAVQLRRMGLAKGDAVATMVTTRLEWTIADLAIMAAGGINVPVYCTYTADRIATILVEAKPKLSIVEDADIANLLKQAHVLSGREGELRVIGVEEGAAPTLVKDLASKSLPEEKRDIARFVRSLGPDDVASYMYTSGTSGELKAVVVTHGMILAEVSSVELIFGFSSEDVQLICLPLAHVLGRLGQLYPLLHGTQSAYAESIEKLAENYVEVRPHYICGVPRMLEKIYERVQDHITKSPARTRRLASWALRVGMEKTALVQKKRPVPLDLKLWSVLADMVFFRRLRARLGGRMKTFICGGARLSEEVTRFFHAVGIPVLEGYGLTETFAAVTVNRRDDYHFGTVGKPLPGVSIKVAADGEILIKGGNVFRQYLGKPRETAACFDAEGWFLTGDLGEYSRDGFLRITGRKKDIIVTAGGKNIAPQRIEAMLAKSPWISHAMVHGDGRKYLTALVTIDEAAVKKHLLSQGVLVGSGDRLALHPEVEKLVSGVIEGKNAELSRFETIKKFAILEGDFSVSGGELTPTLKVRRGFVNAKYQTVLDSLYRD